MRLTKAIFTLCSLVLFTTSTIYAQQRVVRVQGGKKTPIVKIDSTATDSIRRTTVQDSLISRDSLRHITTDSLRKTSISGYKSDSLAKKDSLNSINASYLTPKWQVDSLKPKPLPLLATIPLQRKFKFTQDTISPGALFGLSIIPGLGQAYNKQYWKIPVFYAGIGAFLAGGIITSSQYRNYKAQFTQAVNLNMPREVTDPLQRKMQNAGSTRTVMYALAAGTYLYQLADATFNYRGFNNPVRKATMLAAIFPGAGFIYTKTYWRLPIYYGGFALLGTVVDYNSRNYQRYKSAYDALTDGDPTTADEFNGRYSADILRNARDGYRRNRDLGIIALAGAYILSVVDTYVIATLKNWDVSRDLSVRVEPTFFDNSLDNRTYQATSLPSAAGLSLKLNF